MTQERMTIPEIIERIEGNFIEDSQNSIWCARLYLKELQERWPDIMEMTEYAAKYATGFKQLTYKKELEKLKEFGERAGL